MNKNVIKNDEYVIDITHILKKLYSKAWVIILSCILCAGLLFSYAHFLVLPTYSSEIMLYVNNTASNYGQDKSISTSDINASQSLVHTYMVILENRTTLEEIVQNTGLSYSPSELANMISAEAVNDTEVLRVRVTAGDPDVAADIANCIADVLPDRISKIIDGSSTEIVDLAVPNPQKVAPSIVKYTFVGGLIGILLSAIAIVLFALMDDTVHDESYIEQTSNYTILAKIPVVFDNASRDDKYYSRSYKHHELE